jgi:hypothetical protein
MQQGIKYHDASIQHPAPSIQPPASSIQYPVSSLQPPNQNVKMKLFSDCCTVVAGQGEKIRNTNEKDGDSKNVVRRLYASKVGEESSISVRGEGNRKLLSY